jgi:hypothetical protein
MSEKAGTPVVAGGGGGDTPFPLYAKIKRERKKERKDETKEGGISEAKRDLEKPNERFELPTYRLLSGCSAN